MLRYVCYTGLFGRFLRQVRVISERSSFSSLSRFFERVKAFVSDYEEHKNSTTSRAQTRTSSATASTDQIQFTLQKRVHALEQVTTVTCVT